jgi:two-component system NtrC family sensor kinase
MPSANHDSLDLTPSVTDEGRLLRLLVDQVKDYAIFLLDPDGQVLSWNAGAQLLKGYEAEEIIGQQIKRFYVPEDAAKGKPDLLLAAARKDGRVEDEGWRVRKDGTRFWADVVITALRDEDGILRGFAKVTRDLTERRKTEETLRQAHHELEQRVRERTEELARTNQTLRERNLELENFSDAVVGRELKMMQLEKDNERLRKELDDLTRRQGPATGGPSYSW